MVTCSREELVQKLQVRVVAVRGLAVPAGDCNTPVSHVCPLNRSVCRSKPSKCSLAIQGVRTVVPVEIHTHLVVVVVGRREVVVAVLSS